MVVKANAENRNRIMMTRILRYPSLPPHQQDTQLRVDAFNVDETHWRSLEPRRRLRRKILRLTKKQHGALDRLEFAVTRLPDDCIAQPHGNP